MIFQELREKFRKGMGIKHFENPSINEILGLLKKSQFGAVRFISHKGILYAWDAYDAVHDTFYKNELFGDGFFGGEYNGYIDIHAIDYKRSAYNNDPGDDADVEMGQKLLVAHPYMRKILAAIEKEHNFKLKETSSDRDSVYYDFIPLEELTESAWSSPITFDEYESYIDIGHGGSTRQVLLWAWNGKKLIFHDLEDADDTHRDHFPERMLENYVFGRISHFDRVISITGGGSDLDYFSASYDLQIKYPNYKILRQYGYHDWKVFKG